MAIGFDIVFPEPDRMSPAVAETSFRGLDAATRDKLDALASNDEILADAINRPACGGRPGRLGDAGAA